MFHIANILSAIHISPLDLLKRNIDYVTLVLVTWVSDFILQSLLLLFFFFVKRVWHIMLIPNNKIKKTLINYHVYKWFQKYDFV